jgi:hypothetical protein
MRELAFLHIFKLAISGGRWAPVFGAAAATPEVGALARPSAFHPTFSWWALVTLKPCHAWHGRMLGGVKKGS